MTDLYSPGVFDTRHNNNTTIQASTLQSSKGRLNDMFNIQGLRTVKGRVMMPLYTGSRISGNFCVFNEYDNSPIQLNSGDIILSTILSNGNPTYTNISSVPLGDAQETSYINNKNRSYPINYDNGGIIFYMTGYPIFQQSTNTWIPNMTYSYQITEFQDARLFMGRLSFMPFTVKSQAIGSSISYYNSLGSINNGTNSCYSGNNLWLTCGISDLDLYVNPTVQQVNPSINITLLVLNPFL